MSAWTKTGNLKGPKGDTGASPVYGSLTVAAPSSGSTVTVPDNCSNYVVNVAGLLSALTIKLPAVPPTYDNTVTISTVSTITLLTVAANTGQTMKSAYSALLASGGIRFVYDPVAKIWYRTQ